MQQEQEFDLNLTPAQAARQWLKLHKFFYIKISKFLMAISQSNHQKIEMTLLDRNAMI